MSYREFSLTPAKVIAEAERRTGGKVRPEGRVGLRSVASLRARSLTVWAFRQMGYSYPQIAEEVAWLTCTPKVGHSTYISASRWYDAHNGDGWASTRNRWERWLLSRERPENLRREAADRAFADGVAMPAPRTDPPTPDAYPPRDEGPVTLEDLSIGDVQPVRAVVDAERREHSAARHRARVAGIRRREGRGTHVAPPKPEAPRIRRIDRGKAETRW